jgi:transketolase
MLETAHGICTKIISMHTVKPLDEDIILKAASSSRAIITIEEHSIYGGLGEACAATLLQNRITIPYKIMGIPDEYTVTGSQTEIFDHYGISEKGISEVALNLLKEKVL